MSSHRLRLSRQAEKDFDHILLYTGQKWGLKQLDAYFEKINKALLEVERNPNIGSPCPELSEEHRRFFVGSHVIIYRIQNDKAQVIRILHQSMSLKAL